jgi:hypothetical protein
MAQLVRPAAGGQPERRVAYVPLALHPSHERTISGRRVIGELGEAAAAAGAAAGAGVAAPSIVVSLTFDNSHSVLREKALSSLPHLPSPPSRPLPRDRPSASRRPAPRAPPRTCLLAWPRSDHPGQSLHYAISCVSITPALGAAAADDLAEEQVRRGRARGRGCWEGGGGDLATRERLPPSPSLRERGVAPPSLATQVETSFLSGAGISESDTDGSFYGEPDRSRVHVRLTAALVLPSPLAPPSVEIRKLPFFIFREVAN